MDVFEERPHGVAARPRSRAPILAFLVTGTPGCAVPGDELSLQYKK